MADEALSIWSNENEACAAQVKRLYDVFSRYTEPGTVFCGLCYTPEEVRAITRTPLGLLDEESGRKLLWETADHWESAEQYRHYLPRGLEFLGPPWFVDDLYPTHLFETLLSLGFRDWPADERSAIVDFLECVEPHLRLYGEDDRLEWADGIATLKNPQRSVVPKWAKSVGDA